MYYGALIAQSLLLCLNRPSGCLRTNFESFESEGQARLARLTSDNCTWDVLNRLNRSPCNSLCLVSWAASAPSDGPGFGWHEHSWQSLSIRAVSTHQHVTLRAAFSLNMRHPHADRVGLRIRCGDNQKETGWLQRSNQRTKLYTKSICKRMRIEKRL